MNHDHSEFDTLLIHGGEIKDGFGAYTLIIGKYEIRNSFLLSKI